MRRSSKKVKISCEEVELSAEVNPDGDVVVGGDEDGQLLVKAPVLLPPEIMAYIAKMLDFGSLKNLRQTNKSWSAAVTPEFQRRTVVTLNLMQTLPDLRRLVRETADLNGITAIKIYLMTPRPNLSVNKTLDAKILVVNNRLQCLAPVLKTLELEYFPGISEVFPSPTIHFQALSKLVVSKYGIEESLVYCIFTSLYAFAPILSELVVDKLNSVVLSPLLNKNEEGSKSRNWALAPNLASLTVTDDWRYPSNILQNLVEFPQYWASLDLILKGCPNYEQPFPRNNFEAIIENNKNSLVNFKLKFPLSYDILSFKFPEAFSKLEKLELDVGLELELETLIYSRTFPALKYLSLKVVSQRFLGPDEAFWDTFFSPQVFRGLKKLKLGLEPSWVLYDHRMENLEWAYQIFPNAEVEIIREDN